MGIADLIPGISGGTIALITGVYKDLITSISNINIKIFKESFSKKFKPNKFDVLFFLVFGIILSISIFSRLILFLLENYENQISSFFFVLIHFVNYPLISAGYLFLLSIVLGIIRVKFKNVNYCIVFHILYNFLILEF